MNSARPSENSLYAPGLKKVDCPTEGWIKIQFHLLEKDWAFGDFELKVNVNRKIIYIVNLLKAKHVMAKNLQIYYDAEMTKPINTSDYGKNLGEIFNTKGQMENEISGAFEVFYDFNPGTNNPILLF